MSAFPYVGGKSELSPWIVDHLPDHDCYIEPFSGSASVLLAKPRSKVEVLNDLDGDVVQFFRVARDRPDELREFVRDTPYSRELYNEWADAFYNGHRPEDSVERAGRWVFLRYAAFGGKYRNKSGFKRASHLNSQPPSKIWSQVPDRVGALRDRLRGVDIECLPALELVEKYDSPVTVAYCDPPYLGCEGEYYPESDIDHEELESLLSNMEGRALVSYSDLPECFGSWWVRCRDYQQRARRGGDGWEDQAVERLCMNFRPDRTSTFVDVEHRQTTLTGGE